MIQAVTGFSFYGFHLSWVGGGIDGAWEGGVFMVTLQCLQVGGNASARMLRLLRLLRHLGQWRNI